MHVHMTGNGRAGSGCWLRLTAGHRLLAGYMLRQIGLGVALDSADFDAAYGALLVRLLAESGLSHAVLLAHEAVYHEDGARMDFGSFFVPNECVFGFCQTHNAFLPAASIHPARPDAIAALEGALEAGAVMLKILPNCHNIDCSRPAYRDFWNRMAASGLPLLAHTGGEHTVPQVNPALADPATLRLPLECGVTVIAAHCATRSGFRDPDYFDSLCGMMADHPNLYADLSALNLPIRSSGLKRALAAKKWHPRFVHGSDFPVPVQPRWASWRGILSSAEAARMAREPNPLERDYQIKRLAGFPSSVFTKVWDLLRVRPD